MIHMRPVHTHSNLIVSVFPAGILQPLFYSKNFPKSLNYGGKSHISWKQKTTFFFLIRTYLSFVFLDFNEFPCRNWRCDWPRNNTWIWWQRLDVRLLLNIWKMFNSKYWLRLIRSPIWQGWQYETVVEQFDYNCIPYSRAMHHWSVLAI